MKNRAMSTLPFRLSLAVVLAIGGALHAQGPTEARPLLVGDWPDPTICKDGADYYMTHSSGPFRPALLIWRSRDLQTWTPLGHALPEQEGNVWVSELTKHDGRFLIYYSANNQIYLLSAESPRGPWSQPVKVEGAKTLDVGHVVADDGQRFLFSSTGKVAELSADGTQVISEKRKVHEAWPMPPEWAVECECLESPRIERHGEWYHMLAAQGGTFGPATAHMVIAARARHPLGPWENAPHNPLIHTYSREEAWWTKGHADLIEGPGGQWWAVLLGHRAQHRTLGRCTLIEPIEWTAEGWPRIAPHWPAERKGVRVDLPLDDAFDGPALGLQWQFHRTFDPQRFRFADGALVLDARGGTAGDSLPLCVMPRDECYEVEAELEIDADTTAGLMLFAKPDLHLGLALTPGGSITRTSQGMKTYPWTKDIRHTSHRVTFRLTNRHEDVTLSYRDTAGAWHTLAPGYAIDRMGESLSGVRAALFAHGSGSARFHDFRYRPLKP
jgi:beta-xylosidase